MPARKLQKEVKLENHKTNTKPNGNELVIQ